MAKLEDDSTSFSSLDQKEVPIRKIMESIPPHHLPWLVLDSRHPFYAQYQCFRSSRAVPKSFESNSHAANYTRYCVGSVEGWLIMAERFKTMYPILKFIDPLSNALVPLPSKLPIESRENYRHDSFLKVVASSAPTGPQRCLAVAIVSVCNKSGDEVRRELVLCRLTHESWTMINFAELNHRLLFCDIEVIDRKLYAATKNLPMVFNLKDIDGCHLSYNLVEKVKLDNGNKPVSWLYDYWGLDKTRYVQISQHGPYLVKDATSKELFMIFRDVSLSRSLPITYRTVGFRVLKLENCVASSRLVEVSDLGDRVLFLSKFSNQLVSSGNGAKGSDDMTIEGNCIYFAFNCPGVMLPGGDFGVFSLTNKKVMPLEFSGGSMSC